jgi:dihydroorotase
MATLIKKVRIIDPLNAIDLVDDVAIGPDGIVVSPEGKAMRSVIDGAGLVLAPGLIDLHTHFREPGFVHKECIRSGIRAALCGGVTSALVMPNTNPAIDLPKHVAYQRARASSSGFDLMVAAAATKGLNGEVATDLAALKSTNVKAVTDDGRPIFDINLMEEILRACRRHNMVCMQHAEDLTISRGAAMHQGQRSARLNLSGQPRDAEFSLVERDIKLAEQIGARYHVLHISCKESLRMVRYAQRNGAAVSCEVTPHHLLLCDEDVRAKNSFRKMNPPLRTREDARALLDGLIDGSIAAVASDHAPHSCREKRADFEHAPFGVVGLESAILVLLTLVKKGRLSLTRAIEVMTAGPAKILGEEQRLGGLLGEKRVKNAVLLDPHSTRVFSKRDLAGRSINSPFFGMNLNGRVVATFLNGEIVYRSR